MARLRDVLTGRGRAFVASGTTLAAAGWGLGFTDISRVGVLLLVLPIVTGLISRRQRASLRVERHTSPSRVAVDERAIVTVTMTNAGTRRTPLLLAEERLRGSCSASSARVRSGRSSMRSARTCAAGTRWVP